MAPAAVLRRLAREARKLASECVEGTAPKLIAWDFGEVGHPHCALGEVLARSAPNGDPWTSHAAVERFIDEHQAPQDNGVASFLLISANNLRGRSSRHQRVVFPLLNFADACERALRRAKRGERGNRVKQLGSAVKRYFGGREK